jgi:stringent starvation protein B
MIDSVDTPSTKPYLIRALYEWCTDNGFTPFIAVQVDESVRVPMEFVKDGEIVLNVSFDATSALKLGNDYIEFKGRFGGVARDILVSGRSSVRIR